MMPDTRYRETRSMPVRVQIAALIFMMVQGVLFGVGIVTILATPLSAWAMQLIPALVVVSLAVSIPVSWMIAPRLRLRHCKVRPLREKFGSWAGLAWATAKAVFVPATPRTWPPRPVWRLNPRTCMAACHAGPCDRYRWPRWRRMPTIKQSLSGPKFLQPAIFAMTRRRR